MRMHPDTRYGTDGIRGTFFGSTGGCIKSVHDRAAHEGAAAKYDEFHCERVQSSLSDHL
jgi:hypothetical protein